METTLERFKASTRGAMFKDAAADVMYPKDAPQPDYSEALNVLDRARADFERIVAEYASMKRSHEVDRAQVEQQLNKVVAEKRAVDGKMATIEARALDLEAKLSQTEQRLAEAERYAADAKQWLTKYYTKIVTLFPPDRATA